MADPPSHSSKLPLTTRRYPPLLVWSVGLFLIVLVAGLRLGLQHLILLHIAYGVPMLACTLVSPCAPSSGS